MSIRVAINGYGRIGRNILRAHYEGGKKHDLQFVAINDLGNAQTNAHLTRYDTTHGKFPGTVAVEGDAMVVNGDRIQVCAKRNPAELPWKDLKIDVVLECTGLFTSKEKASAHLKAGAKKVVISAPGEKDVDRTIVVGVNDRRLPQGPAPRALGDAQHDPGQLRRRGGDRVGIAASQRQARWIRVPRTDAQRLDRRLFLRGETADYGRRGQ